MKDNKFKTSTILLSISTAILLVTTAIFGWAYQAKLDELAQTESKLTQAEADRDYSSKCWEYIAWASEELYTMHDLLRYSYNQDVWFSDRQQTTYDTANDDYDIFIETYNNECALDGGFEIKVQ